jgi:hypothetical protein
MGSAGAQIPVQRVGCPEPGVGGPSALVAGPRGDNAGRMERERIVVGTRGRGGPGELLLGSVARTVADRARRPTLVVPVAAGRVHLGARVHKGERQPTSAAS